MLDALYKLFRGDILATAPPAIVAIDVTKDYAWKDNQGDLRIHDGEPSRRCHVAGDLGTIADFAEREIDNTSDETPAFQGAVWYSQNGVVLLVNDADRRETVTMPLHFSDQVHALRSLETKKQPISQADLRKLLKTTFYGNAPENLVGIISKVKWTSAGSAGGDLQRGKASLGKEINERLEGANDIPEYPILSVPIWATRFSARINVEMFLDIDPATQTFAFYPLPGRVDAAIEEGCKLLGKALHEGLPTGYPLYFGTP